MSRNGSERIIAELRAALAVTRTELMVERGRNSQLREGLAHLESHYEVLFKKYNELGDQLAATKLQLVVPPPK